MRRCLISYVTSVERVVFETRKHAKKNVCYPVVIAFNALNAPGLSTLERQAVALEIASVNIGWMSTGRVAGA